MLDLPADFPPGPARALTYAFTKAAHSLAKLFAPLPRTLTCILVGVADTSMAADIAAAAPPSVRHV